VPARTRLSAVAGSLPVRTVCHDRLLRPFRIQHYTGPALHGSATTRVWHHTVWITWSDIPHVRALQSYALLRTEPSTSTSGGAIGVSPKVTQQFAAQSRDFVEGYVAEDAVLAAAREQAAELGVSTVSPGAGAALRLVAAAGNAGAVVEGGTGTGGSGVWLLRGMRTSGGLTTIDFAPEHQRLGRRGFGPA